MAITNGDFETGDLTGWSSANGGDDPGTAVVTGAAAKTGSYGCAFTLDVPIPDTGYVEISQQISTGFTTITIPYECAVFGGDTAYLLRTYLTLHDASHVSTQLNMDSTPIDVITEWLSVTLVKADIIAMYPDYHFAEDGYTTLTIRLMETPA